MAAIAQSLNENTGLISLIALFLALPPFLVLVWAAYRSLRPSQVARLKTLQAEAARVASLKREIEERAGWDKFHNYFGEFLVRDAERKLPHTLETHSSEEAEHSTLALTSITSEYLEFTNGSFGITHIKQIADSWYAADSKDEGAIKVWAVFWLKYRDIVYVRWETDEYWERPQVCCRFSAKRKWPFVDMFYAENKSEFPRLIFKRICGINEVQKARPPGS
jgi:hypothetical protein